MVITYCSLVEIKKTRFCSITDVLGLFLIELDLLIKISSGAKLASLGKKIINKIQIGRHKTFGKSIFGNILSYI